MNELDALGKVLRASRAMKDYQQSYPDLEERLRKALKDGNPWMAKAAETLNQAIRRKEQQDGDWYVQAFGLTATEGRLAGHIVAGGTVASYAATFGVSPATARTQLKSVFAKAGVNRQAELATRLRKRPSITDQG